MQIDTGKSHIPCWIVWGWSTKTGAMHLIAIDLEYRIAQYHYETNKNSDEFLRVHIEPVEANHSWGRDYQSAAFDMIKQDITDSHQDKLSSLRAIVSEMIRAYGNKQDEKFRKLALEFQWQFGMSQEDVLFHK
jgi:hypothetical protein